MTRFHRVFEDGQLKRIPFTADEEAQRDEEEARAVQDSLIERRSHLKAYLALEGKRRRLALVGKTPSDADVDSAEMMLQVEQSILQHKRQTGRSNASENARLDDDLEPLGEAMLTVWQAQQAIKAKISDDTYTTEVDIDAAAEWPA